VTANFEIDEAVAEDPSRSLVWEQVVNGTYLRMALLHGAFGGALDDGEAIR
jgi:aspartate carbamoyltransferase catalytic subunit